MAEASDCDLQHGRTGRPNSDNTLRWFRMEVTMPYDALELDSANKPNLGIRCTLQAYNNTFDLPSVLTET